MKNIYIQFDTFIIAYIFHVFLLQCIKFTKAFFLKEIEQKKKKKKINRNNCNKSNRMHINLKNEKEINNSFDISYGQFMCSLLQNLYKSFIFVISIQHIFAGTDGRFSTKSFQQSNICNLFSLSFFSAFVAKFSQLFQ